MMRITKAVTRHYTEVCRESWVPLTSVYHVYLIAAAKSFPSRARTWIY